MQNFMSFVRRHLVGFIIAFMVVFVAAGAGYLLSRNQQFQPQNLGPQLEYIGKKDLGGCILWWCEVAPYSEYFFATDMDEHDLRSYFKGAAFKESEHQEYPAVSDKMFSNTHIRFTLKSDPDNGFTIINYDHPDHILKTYRLKQTNKQYIIEILDTSYELAKSAL